MIAVFKIIQSKFLLDDKDCKPLHHQGLEYVVSSA